MEMVRSVYMNSSDLSASKQLLKDIIMQYFIRQTFQTEEEVAKQAEHLRHTYSTHTQVEEAKKVHYF